mgnify:CR=1 FL=1
MTVTYLPMLLVDVAGSVTMIVFAFMSLNRATGLKEKHPENILFLYLVWICAAFTIFAVSRSFGHLLKQMLILSHNTEIWAQIGPYSGSINTISFMVVGLITLFFRQSWQINTELLSSRKSLEETRVKLMDLNQTLEQKVVERTEMLTSSEHKCRRIFEQSLDTILMTDENWRILETNPAGVDLTGYSRNELVIGGMHMESLFADKAEWNRISRIIETKEYILNEETEFIKPDGSLQHVILTGGIDYGAFGCDRRFHFIIKNINEKKEMEQQIAQADKLAAVGELSAGVAHEINNPLGIIMGHTQLILKQESGEDFKYFEDLKTIEKHVKNCRTVVADLLAFSRKGSTEHGIMDINRIVRDVAGFMRNHSDFRDVEITLDLFEDQSLAAMGNEQELRQVFINLMINACHAVEKSGTVRITTETDEEGRVLVHVRDNGYGIRRRDISKIFDPFFTTKPVGQGTGLGLSVSYGIVKHFGGTITARNRKEAGAKFTVTLPAAEKQTEVQ